jgi:acetyl-CoA carboxylase biotin carboxyl carrier protein
MDIRKIAQLARLMDAHDLSEINLESEDEKLTLKRGRSVEGLAAPVLAATAPLAALAVPAAAPDAAARPYAGATINSPIVGTFYVAPAPDAPAFVRAGDTVGPETVVCIVEAMKVMNEVKAEMSGVIRRVLVENGTPVEFGQPLFEMDPA